MAAVRPSPARSSRIRITAPIEKANNGLVVAQRWFAYALYTSAVRQRPAIPVKRTGCGRSTFSAAGRRLDSGGAEQVSTSRHRSPGLILPEPAPSGACPTGWRMAISARQSDL